MLYTEEEMDILYGMLINNGYPEIFTRILCNNIHHRIILEVPYEDLPLRIGYCSLTNSIILSWRLRIGK